MKKTLLMLLMVASFAIQAKLDGSRLGVLVCEYSNGDGWSMMTNNLASWSTADRLCREGGGTSSGGFGF